MPLALRELTEEEFQTIFEACGDSDPLGLVLDGEVIGLVNVRYDQKRLTELAHQGIRYEVPNA